MTDYQKANRPDLAILDALSRSVQALSITKIYGLACPNEKWIIGTIPLIDGLIRDGFVTASQPNDPGVRVYAITCKGRAHLVAEDTRLILGQTLLGNTPRVTVCNAPEVPTAPVETDPASALLCVGEDELDLWWNALDVEAKADAFVQWSLGNDGSGDASGKALLNLIVDDLLVDFRGVIERGFEILNLLSEPTQQVVTLLRIRRP